MTVSSSPPRNFVETGLLSTDTLTDISVAYIGVGMITTTIVATKTTAIATVALIDTPMITVTATEIIVGAYATDTVTLTVISVADTTSVRYICSHGHCFRHAKTSCPCGRCTSIKKTPSV